MAMFLEPDALGDPTGKAIIARRHPEWLEHQLSWRWLMDSLEGGNRYRQAVYGSDTRGLPIRNLIRHKREYPDPREQASGTATYIGGQANGLAGLVGDAGGMSYGVYGGTANGIPGSIGADAYAQATDDDYEMRRARTPVPTFLSEVIGIHLGKIYGEEVERDLTPVPELEEWAKDVDGIGTTLDEWMTETISPMLLTLGQLDIVFDHPAAPKDEEVVSKADEKRLKLDGCVASYILPENLVWWRLDSARQYTECLVREYADPDAAAGTMTKTHWRHWHAEGSTLYDSDGKVVEEKPHNFGRPPIKRLFDRRKGRCRNIGKPRYEGIAERQREYYNRDSELILSDTVQAHALLQGPEDYAQADGLMAVGPTWLLPKKKNTTGGSVSYEGFEVVEFPKEGADSLRKNKSDIRDDVDRDGCLTKPAGTAGTDKGSVSQSGVSKQLDNRDGNALLGHISKMLARAERDVCSMALMVLKDDPKAVELVENVTIDYPTVFDLTSAQELMDIWTAFQSAISMASSMVETNVVAFVDFIHKALPGRDDKFYKTAEEEIRAQIGENEQAADQATEMQMAQAQAALDAGLGGQGGDDDPDPDGEAEGGGELAAPNPGPVLMNP